MGKYYITADQLEDIDHHRRMFDFNAEQIHDLCSEERDDVVYGFKLGQMHSHLRECHFAMMKLTDEIRRQTIENEIKNG